MASAVGALKGAVVVKSKHELFAVTRTGQVSKATTLGRPRRVGPLNHAQAAAIARMP